jgi:hypothetical protein
MNLGEISLRLWRTVMGKRQIASTKSLPPEDQKVHERSKKALSHRVKYELLLFVILII